MASAISSGDIPTRMQTSPRAGHACKFCANIFGEERANSPWDRPLLLTDNFALVPSLGSLVPGWLMAIPRRHILSMASLTHEEANELGEIIRLACGTLKDTFGVAPTIFEHGASQNNQLVGCGIDHAHLHIVPLDFDLAEIATQHGIWSVLERGSKSLIPTELMSLSANRPYLYLRTPGNASLLSQPRPQVSQFFRRLIASQLGFGQNQFDYRVEAFEENCAITVSKLAGRF